MDESLEQFAVRFGREKYGRRFVASELNGGNFVLKFLPELSFVKRDGVRHTETIPVETMEFFRQLAEYVKNSMD